MKRGIRFNKHITATWCAVNQEQTNHPAIQVSTQRSAMFHTLINSQAKIAI